MGKDPLDTNLLKFYRQLNTTYNLYVFVLNWLYVLYELNMNMGLFLLE